MFTTAVADPTAAEAPVTSRRSGSLGASDTSRDRRAALLPLPPGANDVDADDGDVPEPRFPEFSLDLEKDLVRVFKLMSDKTRLRILLYLAREGELHVTAMCERLKQSQPAVSHHLALLRNADIIEPRRDGKHNFYSIRQQRFVELLTEFFATVRDPETDAVEFDDFTLSKSE